MVVNCPNCGKQLKMSEKMLASIQQLDAGKKLNAKCVHCAVPFGLGASDLQESGGGSPGPKKMESILGGAVNAPSAPETGWLRDGIFENQDVVADIPKALILISDTPGRKQVIEAVELIGYQIELALTSKEAIAKMRFVNYAAVILDSGYEEGGLAAGPFHRYMRRMEMSRRRFIFYVLVGSEFSTLYDLQALASSANLVVNEAEIEFLGTIFKKAIPEYEALFGPMMEELLIAGK